MAHKMSFFTFIQNFKSDEQGQGTTEYILILAATVLGATQLAKEILRILDASVLRLGGQLEQDLKSGRASLSVWEN